MEAALTYRAMQAVSRGHLELTEKTIQAPGPSKVRIRVEACGVCHSDSGTVEALFPIGWPRVPGHEVVARHDPRPREGDDRQTRRANAGHRPCAPLARA